MRKQNNNLISSTIRVYKDLNVLIVLRRKTLHTKTTIKRRASRFHANFVRVFVTVLLFLIICGPVAYLSHFFCGREETLTPRSMPRRASENGFVGFWCVILLYREVLLSSESIFLLIQQGRKSEREMSHTASRSCTAAQPRHGGPCTAG